MKTDALDVLSSLITAAQESPTGIASRRWPTTERAMSVSVEVNGGVPFYSVDYGLGPEDVSAQEAVRALEGDDR